MMKELRYQFSEKQVDYYLGGSFADIAHIIPKDRAILVTDETIHRLHADKFAGYKTIIIPSGEQFKNQSTADDLISQLIGLEANRKSILVGIGGGVVTDITGYVASIYMRGIDFGFLPTTILAQVDASIGGKNGVDVGLYKNLVGVIRQPNFILFDFRFLETLPREQWINGFAEILKHASIKDEKLFSLLEKHSIEDFQNDSKLLSNLVESNIVIKSDIVKGDEFENGERKLLNFGHTLGHAIENVFSLPHGFAVSIGMAAATSLSVERGLLSAKDKDRLINLIKKYELPVSIDINEHKDTIISNLKMDKKRGKTDIDFILLTAIGQATVIPISIREINELIHTRFSRPALRNSDV